MNHHTHAYTQEAQYTAEREQGRSESLTFTYNLFMLHAVIQHTWEKVNFFHSEKANLKQQYMTLK